MDYQKKRELIERGQLRYWSKRGLGSYNQRRFHSLKLLVQAGVWMTGLRYFGHRNACNIRTRAVRFTFKNLPAAFDGFRILHLSDFHADGMPRLGHAVCSRVRDLPVDLCVLTGDYRFHLHGPSDDVYPVMGRIARGIHARHGILGVLGNHDSHEQVPEFEKLGIRMLVNRSHEIRQGGESLWVLGLDDPHYYGCDDLDGTLADVPPAGFKLLLVHTPELVQEAAARHVDLYLCGHTHGGQVRVPGIKPRLVNTNLARQFHHGPWKLNGMRGYTSSGVGCSVAPVRFFSPPEITLIELRRG